MANRVKQAILLLFTLLLLGAPPALAAPLQESLSRALTGAAGAQGGKVFLEDAATQAATRFASAELDGTASALAHRQILWAEGIRDVTFTQLTIVADAVPPEAALRMFVEGRGLNWGVWDHGGVGFARARDRIAITFLLLNRRAVFSPGVVQLSKDTVSARLVVTNPLGQVGARPLRPIDDRPGAFARDEERQNIPGTWFFELEALSTRGAHLVALWTVDGGPAEPSFTTEATETLGLGPQGLGASEEALTANGALDWATGASAPPPRVPVTKDADAVEQHLRRILQGRRRVASMPPLEAHLGATRVARERAAAAVSGVDDTRPAAVRLLAAGVMPLAAEEVVIVAPDAITGWAHLIADPESRDLVLRGGLAQVGIGASIVSNGPRWTVALTLLRSEIGAEDGSWRSVVQEHIRRGRGEAGLGELYARDPLHAIATRAAGEIAVLGVAQMSEERREALVAEVRRVVPDSTSVGVDVLVTRDPSAVGARQHVVAPRFAEVGVGVVEMPDSETGFAIVVVLVQR